MSSRIRIALLTLLFSAGIHADGDTPGLEQQVADFERAFARTMAGRDLAAFGEFVSMEAVFLGGGPEPLRGREAVTAAWAAYFEGEAAPFSWEPETVVALESGDLALSTGPVLGPDGVRIATFTSTWRQEEPGEWRVIFDRGTRFCTD